MNVLDSVHINFSQNNLFLLNILLSFIMFGVALNIKIEDLKSIVLKPKSALIGAISQFFVLPFVTFLLICIIRPQPSVALGMIMVAACPSGNISNFMSSIAKANVALSVSITAISTVMAIFMTPFNFTLYGRLYPGTRFLLRQISVSPMDMFKTVFLLLGIPVIIGLLFAYKFPQLTQKINKPIRTISLIIFVGFIVLAFSANLDVFLNHLGIIALIVFIHDCTALFSGYQFSRLFKLPQADCRSLSIEAGIRNSGLGLVLIFNFFNVEHLGGMTVVTAWWGIWHIISGLSIAFFWSKRPLKEVATKH
jgi:bile acid:Na+ symporter, BASS family